jgi:hypothetical protein
MRQRTQIQDPEHPYLRKENEFGGAGGGGERMDLLRLDTFKWSTRGER